MVGAIFQDNPLKTLEVDEHEAPWLVKILNSAFKGWVVTVLATTGQAPRPVNSYNPRTIGKRGASRPLQSSSIPLIGISKAPGWMPALLSLQSSPRPVPSVV